MPFLLLINKTDLAASWEVDDGPLVDRMRRGWTVLKTSAKTGAEVETAFVTLAEAMMAR